MTDLELLVEPDDPSGAAALVLAGSSGALEVERAQLLAAHGVLALALRWFGGAGSAARTLRGGPGDLHGRPRPARRPG